MRRFTVTLWLLLILSSLCATTWNTNNDISLFLNQSYYTNELGDAEQSTINWIAEWKLEAARSISDKFFNENFVQLSFGQSYIKTDTWGAPIKSNDKISLESILHYDMEIFVKPYLSVKYESNFITKRDNVSKFMTPVILSQASGFGYTFRNDSTIRFNLRSGIVVKEYFDRFAKDTRHDGGFEGVVTYRHNFRTLRFDSKFNAYQPVLYSEPNGDSQWKNIRYTWENSISVDIVKYTKFKVYSELIRNDKLYTKTQFRQTSGVSISFAF